MDKRPAAGPQESGSAQELSGNINFANLEVSAEERTASVRFTSPRGPGIEPDEQSMSRLEQMLAQMMEKLSAVELKLKSVEEQIASGDEKGGVLRELGINPGAMQSAALLNDDQAAAGRSVRGLKNAISRRTLTGVGAESMKKSAQSMFNVLGSDDM